MELAGGAAIVTGAGGGIGGALAHRLAAEELALVLSDLDADRLAATVASLPERTDVTAVVGDVSDPAHHAELVAVAEDHGGLVLSVLNAAVYLPGQSWDMPIEQWQLQVDVNFWGVLHGVRAAVPAMAAALAVWVARAVEEAEEKVGRGAQGAGGAEAQVRAVVGREAGGAPGEVRGVG